jgi:transcriptional regulator with XRE-family HTH domain
MDAQMRRQNDPENVRIGRQVRAFRLMRKLTQQTLGEAVGVSFQQIQKYERGANGLSPERLRSVARALRVSPRAFFPADDDSAAAPELPDASGLLAQPENLALLQAFAEVKNKAVRKQLIKLVEALR